MEQMTEELVPPNAPRKDPDVNLSPWVRVFAATSCFLVVLCVAFVGTQTYYARQVPSQHAVLNAAKVMMPVDSAFDRCDDPRQHYCGAYATVEAQAMATAPCCAVGKSTAAKARGVAGRANVSLSFAIECIDSGAFELRPHGFVVSTRLVCAFPDMDDLLFAPYILFPGYLASGIGIRAAVLATLAQARGLPALLPGVFSREQVAGAAVAQLFCGDRPGMAEVAAALCETSR